MTLSVTITVGFALVALPYLAGCRPAQKTTKQPSTNVIAGLLLTSPITTATNIMYRTYDDATLNYDHILHSLSNAFISQYLQHNSDDNELASDGVNLARALKDYYEGRADDALHIFLHVATNSLASNHEDAGVFLLYAGYAACESTNVALQTIIVALLESNITLRPIITLPLVRLAQNHRDYRRALDHVDHAQRLWPSEHFLRVLHAELLLNTGDYTNTLYRCREIVRSGFRSASLGQLYGLSAARLHLWAEAAHGFQMEIECSGSWKTPSLGLYILSLIKSGNLNDARKYYALFRASTPRDYIDPLDYVTIARTLQLTSEVEQAQCLMGKEAKGRAGLKGGVESGIIKSKVR